MSNKTTAKSEAKATRANNPVLQLRKVLGLKQVDFAALVAISPSQIASIEIGRRAITPDFAWQVAARTGVDPECLLQVGGGVRDQKGRQYSKQSYEEHLKPRSIELGSSGYDELLAPLRLTMQAAAEAGRLRDFACKLKESVERQISLLPGVQEAVQRLVERGSGARGRVTVGDLKRDPALADKLWGDSAAEELEGRADDEVVFERKIDPERFLWRSPWYSVAKKVREDANQSMANR